VVIGKCCMICGQVGIAGSATYVYLHLIDELFILLGVSYNPSCPPFENFPIMYTQVGGLCHIRWSGGNPGSCHHCF
jgi:hypothetical protein